MTFAESPLKGSYIITPKLLSDGRGWFMRTFCKNDFKSIGHEKEWVQMNHSFTQKQGTIRGMHYQQAPFEEVKLVRCVSGVVYDAIIDFRKDSETYLQWFGVELSAENKKMLYIPEGFAHGFQALSENVELVYLHTAVYNQQSETGIRYDDEMIGISWPLPLSEISDRDLMHPSINK